MGEEEGRSPWITHLLNNHCRFVTEDLDLSREVMGRLWEHHELRLNSGWKYGIRWHQVDLKRMPTSVYMYSPTSVHVVSGPLSHTYRFGFHVDGTAHYSINGYESTVTPECAVVNAPGQMLDVETQPHRRLLSRSTAAFVDKALTRRFGAVPPLEEWAREFSTPIRSDRLPALPHAVDGDGARQTRLLAARVAPGSVATGARHARALS